jgi:hypothetical protein
MIHAKIELSVGSQKSSGFELHSKTGSVLKWCVRMVKKILGIKLKINFMTLFLTRFSF